MSLPQDAGPGERPVHQFNRSLRDLSSCQSSRGIEIGRPKEIAYFSFDNDHVYRQDDSSLRYYWPPTEGADLVAGFETFRKLDDTRDDHLEGLLRTIIDLEKKQGTPCKHDLITWRGMMTKIMATPFDDFDGFEMNATYLQGTIFLEENHSYKLRSRDSQMQQRPQRGPLTQEQMSFMGYKFEVLATIPDIWDKVTREQIENRDQEIVDNHAQYCSVVETSVGETSLILGGEVDCVWDSKPRPRTYISPDTGVSFTEDPPYYHETGGPDMPPIHWVELKTCPQVRSPRDLERYEKRLLKYWIQSKLLGVPHIIVGMRSSEGRLTGIDELYTDALPEKVKSRGRSWDDEICIRFTAEFLQFLKMTIQNEVAATGRQDGGVWRIRRQAKSKAVEIFRIADSGHGDILSDEFVQWRMDLQKQQATRVADMLMGKG